jgi:hypothetical protein
LIVPFVGGNGFVKAYFSTSIFFLARLIRLNGFRFSALLQSKGTSWPQNQFIQRFQDFSSNIMLALVAKAIHLLEALD